MNYKSFETKRLILRPTTEEDSHFVYEIFNTPKWIKYIGDRNINSVEMAREYIKAKILTQLERLGFSSYTVISKNDETKVGICGLYDRDGLQGIDIGFAFLPEHEKQGYAFEAANRLKEAAFNDFGLNAISAITKKDNLGSQRLLEKLGLHYKKMIRMPNNEELLLYFIERVNN